ncbi:MAG: spore coat protein [Candidatus Moranbacteria bacterium CG_4_8_14_3_um_filter_43_15]|nr:MAG: spore coat protein [Candidatus Moranbacteria bacterium CG_4_8_14_3_um_filter_43_15]PJA85339.1 MAG: spore coat protein [Candidatus Moranbacteria bacterium CG_4_9_14_3_um_filter_44_28]
MKGIILAGGTATRLFPLTHTTSKQLLPVYDKQMIFYPLNTLVKAGIKDVLIIIAPRDAGQFLNLLGPIFDRHEVRLEFKVQSAPRGLAEAFVLGENFIDNDNVTMILGDNIFEDDFSEIIKNFQSGGHVFAKKVPDPERYGIVEFDKSGKAVRIVEKPKKWISDYAIPGLYIFDHRVCEVAKKSKPSDRGEIEITDLMNFYLKKSELQVSQVEGEWLDAGTFDTLLEASRIVKEKNLYENFDPKIEAAIAEFNEEQKVLAKKQLQ